MQLLTFSLIAILLAQGKLPRGPMPTPETGAQPSMESVQTASFTGTATATETATATATATMTQLIDAGLNSSRDASGCFRDLLSPKAASLVFAADTQDAWLLASVAPRSTKAQKIKGKVDSEADRLKQAQGKRRYVVYRIDLKSRKTEPVIALEQSSDAVLLLHGEPVMALSIVGFFGTKRGCLEGKASIVYVRFADKSATPIQVRGDFVLTQTPKGAAIVDRDRESIVLFDQETFQARSLRKVPPLEQALYFDFATQQLITWADSKEFRGLKFYLGNKDESPKQLAIKVGDKIIQDGDQFAVVQRDAQNNSITLQAVQSRDGTEQGPVYTLSLPPTQLASLAGVELRLSKKIAVVAGVNNFARREWRQAFIFDLKQPAAIATVRVSRQQYVANTALDARGRYALFEIRDLQTQYTTGVQLYDFITREFTDLQLPPAR